MQKKVPECYNLLINFFFLFSRSKKDWLAWQFEGFTGSKSLSGLRYFSRSLLLRRKLRAVCQIAKKSLKLLLLLPENQWSCQGRVHPRLEFQGKDQTLFDFVSFLSQILFESFWKYFLYLKIQSVLTFFFINEHCWFLKFLKHSGYILVWFLKFEFPAQDRKQIIEILRIATTV